MHRTLARLFHERGVKMLRTSQLNVGGNMDFYNMLERERLESKKISKTHAVTSIMGHKLPEDDVYIGPSDYVPWLTDRKWAHIRVEGQAFGDVPLNLEMKLEVWDSPNSAGIVIDAVRCCKLALNHGVGGQLDGPSSYLMKSPQEPAPRRRGAPGHGRFIAKYGGKQGPTSRPKGRTAPQRPRAQAGGQEGRRQGLAPAGPFRSTDGPPPGGPSSFRRRVGSAPPSPNPPTSSTRCRRSTPSTASSTPPTTARCRTAGRLRWPTSSTRRTRSAPATTSR